MTNKEKALINDKRLEELAVYVLTKGTTVSQKLPKDMADMNQMDVQIMQAEFMIAIQDKFSELKRLVTSGEFTLIQLEDKVYEDYGVMEEPQTPNMLPNMSALEKIVNGTETQLSRPEKKSDRITGFDQQV